MAASLQKKIHLVRRARLVDKSGLVESCFSIVSHETRVCFAFVASEETEAVQILGWRNRIAYGRDKGSEGFGGNLMGKYSRKLRLTLIPNTALQLLLGKSPRSRCKRPCSKNNNTKQRFISLSSPPITFFCPTLLIAGWLSEATLPSVMQNSNTCLTFIPP